MNTPKHLIRAAKTHTIGREQDIFLAGAKYGHANKTISADAIARVSQGWPLVDQDGVVALLLDALPELGITIQEDA